MGTFLGRGAQPDPLLISTEMRKSVRLWENAHIAVLDPGPNGIKLKNRDNTAFIWHGMARAQPYRREIAVAAVGNPTTTGSVRFQVDFGQDGALPDIRTGFHVVVLKDVTVPDPYLSEYQHVVQAALNSSFAWIRTIETMVNTEVRVNYNIVPNGSGGLKWG